MAVSDLLTSQRRWGHTRCRKLLAQVPLTRAQDARLDDRSPAPHARRAALGRAARDGRPRRAGAADQAPAQRTRSARPPRGTRSSPPERHGGSIPSRRQPATRVASSSHALPPPPPARPYGRAGWPAAERVSRAARLDHAARVGEVHLRARDNLVERRERAVAVEADRQRELVGGDQACAPARVPP